MASKDNRVPGPAALTPVSVMPGMIAERGWAALKGSLAVAQVAIVCYSGAGRTEKHAEVDDSLQCGGVKGTSPAIEKDSDGTTPCICARAEPKLMKGAGYSQGLSLRAQWSPEAYAAGRGLFFMRTLQPRRFNYRARSTEVSS